MPAIRNRRARKRSELGADRVRLRVGMLLRILEIEVRGEYVKATGMLLSTDVSRGGWVGGGMGRV